MSDALRQCPFAHDDKPQPPAAAPVAEAGSRRRYVMKGGPKGWPILGLLPHLADHRVAVLGHNAMNYGDFVPYKVMGKKFIQINHPDLIRYVLVENHKNYRKSDLYIQFESAAGQGLLLSNGDKWKRDRQKVQPMFRRELIEGYYFDIISEVTERYKKRWLELTEKGPAEIDLGHEMAAITIEVILRSIFGKDNLDEPTILALHRSYSVMIDYLKNMRILPRVDIAKLFRTPAYRRFQKEIDYVDGIFRQLLGRYRSGELTDKYNLLTLLMAAQKEDPEHFTEKDIRDQYVSMVFAGFETTSVTMQWVWHVLDTRPDIVERLYADIAGQAPCTLKADSSGLTYDMVSKMGYLDAVFKETMRLYPPFWASSRQPLEDDWFGDYKVERGTVVVTSQIVMHRHPRFWDDPNAFIPERFFPENEGRIDQGLYFPFSHGPRKCSGFKFAETEAKIILAKLLPQFQVRVLNALGNDVEYGISMKFKRSLRAEIRRRS